MTSRWVYVPLTVGLMVFGPVCLVAGAGVLLTGGSAFAGAADLINGASMLMLASAFRRTRAAERAWWAEAREHRRIRDAYERELEHIRGGS